MQVRVETCKRRDLGECARECTFDDVQHEFNRKEGILTIYSQSNRCCKNYGETFYNFGEESPKTLEQVNSKFNVSSLPVLQY